MKGFPATPSVADAPDDLLSGHLWLLELIEGRPLRFQLQASGLLRFGDPETVYDDPEGVPLPLRRAVRHIRESLDRAALRAAVNDVAQVVFFGVATTRESVPYELDSMPPFLGTDVWAGDDEAFRPPDAADGIFERLGLEPVNPFEREAHARDFTLDSYESPGSAWYDGPAAGVVLRNKAGHRGILRNTGIETVDEETTDEMTGDVAAADLAERYATADTIESVATTVKQGDEPATVDTVTERLLERIGRQRPGQVTGSGSVDVAALRSAIASRVQQTLQR
ncbi:MAG: hypothetical protein A07HN63_01277 [uncultured archaeon A07HN63]|nr:MAG: hypothetical protein A07HN63_01277 [uncultured archaeon A07HN63]